MYQANIFIKAQVDAASIPAHLAANFARSTLTVQDAPELEQGFIRCDSHGIEDVPEGKKEVTGESSADKDKFEGEVGATGSPGADKITHLNIHTALFGLWDDTKRQGKAANVPADYNSRDGNRAARNDGREDDNDFAHIADTARTTHDDYDYKDEDEGEDEYEDAEEDLGSEYDEGFEYDNLDEDEEDVQIGQAPDLPEWLRAQVELGEAEADDDLADAPGLVEQQELDAARVPPIEYRRRAEGRQSEAAWEDEIARDEGKLT